MFARAPRRIAALAVAALATAVTLAGATAASATTESAATTTSTPRITKVLVFIEENHSLSQMESSMPFVYGLAQQYAYATNYTAIRHPSLPNYLAIAGGSTFGVTDDNDPSAHRIRGNSVFDQ